MKGKTGFLEMVSAITKIALFIAFSQQLCLFVDGASEKRRMSLRTIASMSTPQCTSPQRVKEGRHVPMGNADINVGPVKYWTDTMTECSFLVLVGKKQDDDDDDEDGCIDMSEWGLDAEVLAALQADCQPADDSAGEVALVQMDTKDGDDVLSMATHVQGSELEAFLISNKKTTYKDLIKDLIEDDWIPDTVNAQIFLGSDGHDYRQGRKMAKILIDLGIDHDQITVFTTGKDDDGWFVAKTTYDSEGGLDTQIKCLEEVQRGAAGVTITADAAFENGWYLYDGI